MFKELFFRFFSYLIYIYLLVCVFSCSSVKFSKDDAIQGWRGDVPSRSSSRYSPIIGKKGMVVCDDREAAQWGIEVLRRGGNAIDAAVATAFALSVSRPHYAALGGGGFLLYCPSGKATACKVVDFREQAPSQATKDMFIKGGIPQTNLSKNGPLASGVPGIPAGLLFAQEKYGTFKRELLLTKPIAMAKNGIRVSGNTEYNAFLRWGEFNAEAKKIFSCKNSKTKITSNSHCEAGELLKQQDLALVLAEISKKGAKGFYQGWVAERLVAGINQAGGILSKRDFASYQVKEREPISLNYRGMEVVSMPPPSSGGAIVLQMLSFAERANLAHAFDDGFGSSEMIHAISHAMSLSFADRAEYFGDPDFFNVPIRQLLNSSYLDHRWQSYQPDTLNLPKSFGVWGHNSNHLTQNSSKYSEPTETTHFSVVDRFGNGVAVTLTLNGHYGSAFVPPGTGVVMNNQMDDFSVQPNVPNAYELIGATVNSIQAGKRPLSSMSPTIVRDQAGQVRVVIGAQGGSAIPTSVFLALLNRYQFGMSIVDAVHAPRFHHQWRPLDLKIETHGFSPDVYKHLSKMGYKLKQVPSIARINALERFENGRVWGVPDLRAEGVAIAE